MPRKKKDEAEEARKPVEIAESPAEIYAKQRRIGVCDSKTAELVFKLMKDAGIKPRTRGDGDLTYVFDPFPFVIDHTK